MSAAAELSESEGAGRVKLPRPTAAELSAALSPSSETAQVDIAKPVYDYLAGKLHDRETVSAYVSSRITSELVRLSKMKSGGNHTGWKTSSEQRSANARIRWARTPRVDTMRVIVFDEPHKAFVALSENKQERTRIAGEVVAEWCEAIDGDALLAYCAANPHKPRRFITLPKGAVDAAKAIASRFSVPFSKVICYILANEA